MKLGGTLGGLVLLLAAPAFADEPLEQLLEQQVVSTASLTQEVAQDAPATMSVLGAEDIRRYGIRSLDEAIDFLGMGLITQNPLHSVEIGGRGVQLTADYGVHCLVLVDGHVLNEAWAQAAYYDQGNAVPIELIDHIEVLLGPGSVLYGGNAMLAVINITTKSASQSKGVRAIAEGSLSPAQSGGRISSFSSKDLGNSYRIGAVTGQELTLWGKKIGVTLHVEHYEQNGPAFTFAPERYSNADGTPKSFGARAPLGLWGGTVRNENEATVNSAHAKITIGDFTFAFRAAAFKRSTPYDNYITRSFGDFDDPRSYERDRWLSFDARWHKQLTPKLGLDVHGSFDSYDYLERIYAAQGSDCSITLTTACADALIGVARWSNVEPTVTYDWLGDDRLSTLAGASLQLRSIGNRTETSDQTSGRTVGAVGADDGFEGAWAAFAQQRWSPLRFVHLNAGARFDDGPRGGAQLSPRAAASFDVWRGGAFKMIYSQAFRAPTFYETAFAYADQAPAPNLASEREKSAEASIEQRFGRHKILFGVFRTWWSELIQLALRPDGLLQFQNIGSIDNWGYNARVEGAIGSFRYGAAVTGAHAHRSDGTPLVVSPEIFGNARVSYILPGSLPTIALASVWMGPRLADRAQDGGFAHTPGVNESLRLKLTLTGDVPRVRGLSYRVGVDYATAKHSPYVAGPLQSVTRGDPTPAQLAPVNRLTAFAGLQYEF